MSVDVSKTGVTSTGMIMYTTGLAPAQDTFDLCTEEEWERMEFEPYISMQVPDVGLVYYLKPGAYQRLVKDGGFTKEIGDKLIKDGRLRIETSDDEWAKLELLVLAGLAKQYQYMLKPAPYEFDAAAEA